jgi:hypothetical protein
VYERFIAANNALFACYDAVPVESYNSMSSQEQTDLCKNEQQAVRDFLKNDSVHFRELIKARLASMEQHH